MTWHVCVIENVESYKDVSHQQETLGCDCGPLAVADVRSCCADADDATATAGSPSLSSACPCTVLHFNCQIY